jgi:ABC-type nitrate/sulfonate/bicarbonate transport system substrate-binding protein
MRTTLRTLTLVLACASGLMQGPALAQVAVTVHVAITPINYDAVPILYALKTGLFQKAGLDVQLQRIGSGAAIGAAVASGQVDLGKSSSVSILQGFAHGVPFRLIAPGAMYDDRLPNVQLLVAKDSPIHTAKDLNGQTLATQTVGAIDTIALDAWLERNGGDPASIKWVEIPMTAGVPALEQHRAAAQIFTAPLLDDALATGQLRALAPVYSAIAPRFLFSVYFSTADWVAKNPDTVRKFAAVLKQAAEYTNAHHDEVAPIVAASADQTVAVMLKTQWAIAGTTLDTADLQPLIDASAKYGVLPRSFPARSMLP